MADIFVTAETRQLDTGEWQAVAYPGGDPFRVTAATEQEVHQAFLDAWNDTRGTSYTLDNVDFVPQS